MGHDYNNCAMSWDIISLILQMKNRRYEAQAAGVALLPKTQIAQVHKTDKRHGIDKS